MARVLREGLLLDGRTFDPIIKRPGQSWRTIRHRCFTPEELAALVRDPEVVVGIRHRSHTRLAFIDVDAHGSAPSPYWRVNGQSPELQRLEALAVEHGLGHCLMRSSSSGGLHVHLVLPVPVHREIAHHVLLLLVKKAGIEPGPGRCELFPSSTRFTPGDNPKTFALCHGLRLPGQAGSALWAGGRWVEQFELQWQELAVLLEATVPTPAWEELLAAAVRAKRAAHRQQQSQPRPYHRPRRASANIRHAVAWTAPHQSNDNLGRLANAVYRQTTSRDPNILGAKVVHLALHAPGFEQHASADSKARLETWARDWAQCCLRNPPVAVRQQSRDPGRNQRLAREASCRMIAAAHSAAKQGGLAAAEWSLRAIAAFTGLHRQTVKNLLHVWQGRVRAAFYASRGRRLFVAGTHPAPSRGSALPAVFSVEHRPLELVHSGTIASDRSPPPSPPPRSGPHDWLAQKKARELAELAAWISAA